MAPRTRNFLIGSSLVVVVGLCTGLVAYYGGNLSGGSAQIDFRYIPSDVTAVGYADVRGIMASEFRQKLRQVIPTGQDKDRLFQETGIDIEKDIDSVVAGFTGSGPEDGGAIAVLRGRFDEARVEALAVKTGARVEDYGGKRLLVGLANAEAHNVQPEGAAHRVPALAFLGDGLLALGDEASLRRAIDAAAGESNITTNPELMRMIAGVENTGNAWLVGRVAALREHHELPDQVRSQISGLEWLALSAQVDSSVRAMLRAEARDDKAAQDLRTVVNGALAAARLFGGQDARVQGALSSVQSTGTGRTVELSFTVPAEILDMMGASKVAPPAPPTAPMAPAPPPTSVQ